MHYCNLYIIFDVETINNNHMKKTNRRQTNYNKIVDIAEDGEITVLDYTFDYGDGFKGAVGTKFIPVSKSQYDEDTSEDNVIDMIIEAGVPPQFARKGAEGCYEAMKDGGEIEVFIYDISRRELWGYLREEAGLTEEEAHVFNCVGGGRCFEKDFKGNKNRHLSKIIRQYEK